MPPSGPVPSISTESSAPRAELRAVLAAARGKFGERFALSGWGGYVLISLLYPIFSLSLAALIYGGRPDLLAYTVVAQAAQSLIFSAIFFVGEILDRERLAGTLPALFLAPCSRLGWLSGFSLVGLIESALMAASALLFGSLALGIRFAPDWPALLLTLALFVVALWGMGVVFSAIGLLLKRANEFSNLVFPLVMLLGGAYYPVALLPDWLRYPARALPFGYGIQALASAALDGAGVVDLLPALLPLALFALLLPAAGVIAFRWLEWLIRQRGELDLY
jgi:ABC-2 type transport system permease protein